LSSLFNKWNITSWDLGFNFKIGLIADPGNTLTFPQKPIVSFNKIYKLSSYGGEKFG